MRGLVVATLLCLVSSAASADDCTTLHDLKWYRAPQFFSTARFGAIGFSLDKRAFTDRAKIIYVPDDDTACVTFERKAPFVQIVMNHRNADFSGKGYVSFKLYGFSLGKPTAWTRALDRSGTWTLNNAALPAWQPSPSVKNGNDPSLISDYEAFYSNGTQARDAFDRDFGTLHGSPAESPYDSWADRPQMQPEAGQLDPSKVAYMFHDLQRLEVVADVNAPGTPPAFTTDRYKYFYGLLLRVFTPLGQGEHTTIRLKFT